MGPLLAAVSSLLWGTGDFIGGTLSRRAHPVAVIRTAHGIAAVGLVVVVTIAGEWGRSAAIGWGAAAGVMGLVGLGTFYAALATGTMGIVSPLSATGVLVPVAVGLARGEDPGPVALAGIAVTIAGVVLVSGPERDRTDPGGPDRGTATVHAGPSATVEEAVLSGTAEARAPAGRRHPALGPLVLAGVSAVAFGATQVLIAEAAAHSVALSLLSMRATTTLVATIVLATVLRHVARQALSDVPTTAISAGTDTAAVGLFSLAVTMGTLSISAVLASFYPAVTAVLAWRIHGERLRKVQVAGVATILAGVALIAAG